MAYPLKNAMFVCSCSQKVKGRVGEVEAFQSSSLLGLFLSCCCLSSPAVTALLLGRTVFTASLCDSFRRSFLGREFAKEEFRPLGIWWDSVLGESIQELKM